MTIIKSAYSEKIRKSFTPIGVSKTQQNFKKECDINNILSKYQKTGLITHSNKYQGDYTDLSEPTDYQTALNIVIAAQESFSSLPSGLRTKFNNDPSLFLDFVSNPDNIDEIRELGLAKPLVPVVEVPPPPAEPNDPPEATS